jgi:ABC-type branched-subunit amino acid transport system substrate-binding protein
VFYTNIILFMKNLILFLIISLSLLPYSHSEEPTPFKLGVILPLSGNLAFFGNAHLNSEKLFKEDNANANKKLTIIYEDSGYDAKQAISAYRKLLSVDKVDAIYCFGGPMLSALAPLAEADKIPFFAPESEDQDAKDKKYVTLFRNITNEFGKVVWDELRSRGVKNLGVVRNSNQFMDTVTRGVIDNAKNGEVVSKEIDAIPGSVDFRTQILKLKKKKLDYLLVLLLPGSHRAFLKQSMELGYKLAMIGVEEFAVTEENAGLENYIEDTLVVAPYVTEEFRTRYNNKFGSDLGIEYGVEYYDFLSLVTEIIPGTDKRFSNEYFIEQMHFAGEKTGISGKYSLKRTDTGATYYSFPIALYKVKGGKLVTYKVVENF